MGSKSQAAGAVEAFLGANASSREHLLLAWLFTVGGASSATEQG